MLKLKSIKNMFKMVRESMSDSYCGGIAAELAFFFLFSIVPIFMVIGQLSRIFPASLNFLIELINQYTPKEFAQILIPYLKASDVHNTGIIFLVLSIWFASQGFQAFIRISNYAYGFEVKGIKNLFRMFKGVVLTLLVIFMILFGLIFIVYGSIINNVITSYLYDSFNIQIKISHFWYYLVAFAVFFYTLSFVYSWAPVKRIAFKRVVPGALFGTVGSIVASLVFSFYVANFASYDIIYKGLTNIIILMLWFYIIGYILVIGIHINITYEKIMTDTN